MAKALEPACASMAPECRFEYFGADRTTFCPQKIGIYCEISGKNVFFFFLRRQTVTYRQQATGRPNDFY